MLQCKPRQDERAQDNLACQGYACYRPQLRRERIINGRKQWGSESLFLRYLFNALASTDNCAPLRSIRGRIVGFGGMLLKVAPGIIELMRQRTEDDVHPVLNVGDVVPITTSDLAELEATFQAMDGDERVIRLLSMLNWQ